MDTKASLCKGARRVRRLRSKSNLVILPLLHPYGPDSRHTHLPRVVHNQRRIKKYLVVNRFDGGVTQSPHFYLSRYIIQAQSRSRSYAAGYLVCNPNCSHRHQLDKCDASGRHRDAAVANLHRNGFLLPRLNVYEFKLALKCSFSFRLLFRHLYLVDPQSC